MSTDLKLSICIIAYNEEKYLPRLLGNVGEQQYPHHLTEVVLVDSCSTDNTKQIFNTFSKEKYGFYSIQILDNPKKIQSAGWNVAIKSATGDVIARIDAHSELPANFSQLAMEDIAEGEHVVGGMRPCIIENNDSWGRVLLATENSMFGSSISIFRRSSEKQYVKSVFHAFYRKEVFEKAGMFNELLIRTEDNEMHFRIREAGYRICYDPRIVSYQFARNSLRKMIRQKYGNGYWIGLTTYICPRCLSAYHYIPVLFIFGIILTTILVFFGFYHLAAIMWGAYAFLCVWNTIGIILENGFEPLDMVMPVLFLALHVSYGIGTLAGLINIKKAREINRCSAKKN